MDYAAIISELCGVSDYNPLFATPFSTEPALFQTACLELFRQQYERIEIYRRYADLLKIRPQNVQRIEDIPFMPVEFFKSYDVIAAGSLPEETFTSSGTTGQQTSRHLVADTALYRDSFRAAFELFYGPVTDYCVLALLPSYLERDGSSLIFMADDMIRSSGHAASGFYLNELEKLSTLLMELNLAGQKTLLLGVTFALLDLAENFPSGTGLPNTIVMETGGMKGKRKEMVREEVHQILTAGLGQQVIHSEYGMTELLSQAYSDGAGLFRCPPWMKIMIREPNDPLSLQSGGRSGGINVIDLANRHSCAFIATQDLGKVHDDGSFEVLGRFDNSDIRGCNLLAEM